MAIRALPIVSPCSASFGAMRGDDRSRYCDSCEKEVHDLSARTEEEARAFLTRAHGQRICVRYAKDARGSIRFRAATMAAAVSLAACTAATEPDPTTPVQTAPTAAAQQNGAALGDENDRDMGDAIIDVEDLCPDGPDPNDDGCLEKG